MQPLTTTKEYGSESILPEKRQGALPVEVSQIKSDVPSGNIICRSLGFNHLTVTLIGGGPTGGVVGMVINGGVVMCRGVGMAGWVGVSMGMEGAVDASVGVGVGMGADVCMGISWGECVGMGVGLGEGINVCVGICVDVGLDGEAMMGALVTNIVSVAEVTFASSFVIISSSGSIWTLGSIVVSLTI